MVVSGLGLCMPDFFSKVCRPKSDTTASSLPFPLPAPIHFWLDYLDVISAATRAVVVLELTQQNVFQF